jgi:hypothetical protein
MKIHKRGDCEYWYDRSYRCWFAGKVDSDGNLVDRVDNYGIPADSTINAYTKKEIIFLIDRGDLNA